MTEQWEYIVLALTWDQMDQTWKVSGAIESTATTMTEALNGVGEAGWELVTLSPSQSEVRGAAHVYSVFTWKAYVYQAVFKRRRPE